MRLILWPYHTRTWETPFHEKAGMSQVCFSLSVFSFLPVDSWHSSRAASVAILPSALFVERFSLVHGGRSQFSRCCNLIIDLGSRHSTEAGPGVRRSHLISAVGLGCSDSNLRHCTHHFVVVSQWFLDLST